MIKHLFILLSLIHFGTTLAATKVAFIGDTGAGRNFRRVLDLIKQEGAELTIIAGDTSYSSRLDSRWDAYVKRQLNPLDAALLAAGNHDYTDSKWPVVRTLGIKRLDRNPRLRCKGDYGQQMKCKLKNLYIVLSSIGSQGSQESHEGYLYRHLRRAPDAKWRICVWHKNQREMQVGDKRSEIGWKAYETCRQHGAIIATGHEHSYSRTHLLSNMQNQTVSNRSNEFTVTKGETFAFVSGLGGQSIRSQKLRGDHWGKIYTSSQRATYGALFGEFFKTRAHFYFKTIDGKIIDEFTVHKGF